MVTGGTEPCEPVKEDKRSQQRKRKELFLVPFVSSEAQSSPHLQRKGPALCQSIRPVFICIAQLDNNSHCMTLSKLNWGGTATN